VFVIISVGRLVVTVDDVRGGGGKLNIDLPTAQQELLLTYRPLNKKVALDPVDCRGPGAGFE